MDAEEAIHALIPLVEALEQLGISYYVGGSLASSVHGISRPTQDADVVADIRLEHVRSLVRNLEAEYYIDADTIREAIRYRSSFNAIFLGSMLKVDVFIPKLRSFTQQEQLRASPRIIEEGYRPFLLSSPEDIILNKLEWYKMGGESSTRQWNDILGVLEHQGTKLDPTYLERWARALDVAELLERAITEAKLNR